MNSSKIQRLLHKFAGCAVATTMLTACEGPNISISDVIGVYRAQVPGGEAILEISQDSVWDYRIEGTRSYHRAGKWVLVSDTRPSVVVISFHDFSLGLPEGSSSEEPGYWHLPFEANYSGKLQMYIEDLDPRFWGPKGKVCFARE